MAGLEIMKCGDGRKTSKRWKSWFLLMEANSKAGVGLAQWQMRGVCEKHLKEAKAAEASWWGECVLQQSEKRETEGKIQKNTQQNHRLMESFRVEKPLRSTSPNKSWHWQSHAWCLSPSATWAQLCSPCLALGTAPEPLKQPRGTGLVCQGVTRDRAWTSMGCKVPPSPARALCGCGKVDRNAGMHLQGCGTAAVSFSCDGFMEKAEGFCGLSSGKTSQWRQNLIENVKKIIKMES